MTESESTSRAGAGRLWVDIDTTQPIMAAGLRTILETEFGASIFTTVGPVDGEPDVILYDVMGLVNADTTELDRLGQQTSSVVIAISYDRLRPDLEALVLQQGAAAVVPLGVSAAQLAEVIQAAMEGTLDDVPIVRTPDDAIYPGKAAGLSRRESAVLALIVLGRSNREIASECFLSTNTVKTFIRSAYRKIGISHRAQAVAWTMQHGFPPPPDHGQAARTSPTGHKGRAEPTSVAAWAPSAAPAA
jgi:DNA-binding NarL/FixJ family response regulator